jgi:hypothetical protein
MALEREVRQKRGSADLYRLVATRDMICRLITMWSPGYVRVLRERTKNRRQSILHFLLGELRLESELDSYIRDKRARFSDFPHGPTTLL